MEMTLRWYGTGFDTVTLQQIRQIPGVTGVITTLYDTQPGEVWSQERIHALKAEVEAAGLNLSGIESVNVHDAIKTGAPERDQYIANYIETLENLGKEDIHLVCYNFMPVFDWTRTELARKRPDGSTVLAYTQAAVDALDPEKMFDSIAGDMNGTIMPGWEPERMARVKELFALYKDIDDEKLFANLVYFLESTKKQQDGVRPMNRSSQPCILFLSVCLYVQPFCRRIAVMILLRKYWNLKQG